MNSPQTHKTLSRIFFTTIVCILSIVSIESAVAFNPQPEPPGLIMPTLNPEDALRINIAYVADQSRISSRCKILIRSLFNGNILKEEDITLEPGKGMSKDYSYEELLGEIRYEDGLLDAARDLPLLVQIKATSRNNIFVGVEIHNTLLTDTRTYIPIGAAPLYIVDGSGVSAR